MALFTFKDWLTGIFAGKTSQVVANIAIDNNGNAIGNKSIDATGNEGLNTTFGDTIVATRIPSITAQFFYGLTTGNTNPIEDDAIITETNGGTVGITDGELILTSGTNAAAVAKIQSNDYVRYIPGFEMYCLFTYKFDTPQVNCNQLAGLYDDNNGFIIGYKDTQFMCIRRKDGTDYETNITPSDYLDGDFDPTKYNIYYIKYGFLGVAPIKFSIVKPTGGFEKLFTIEYPNMYNEIHTAQTFLPVRAEIVNSGNTTSIVNKSGSVSAGIVDGGGSYPGTRYITKDLGVISITAGTTLLGIFRNKTTFNSIANRIKTKLLSVSAASEGTKTVKIEILKNPTITVAGTWADVKTNKSVMEFSTNSTINTATGTDLIDFNLAKAGQVFQPELTHLNLTLRAGEWAAILATTTGASDLEFSMRWEEQF